MSEEIKCGFCGKMVKVAKEKKEFMDDIAKTLNNKIGGKSVPICGTCKRNMIGK